MRTMFDVMLDYIGTNPFQPFRPYRIVMKDGHTYDIKYSDGVFVGISRVSLSNVTLDLPGVAGNWHHLPIDSIQAV